MNFDLVVEKLERHAKEKENEAWGKYLENNAFGDNVVEEDEHEYFNGKLNLTLRLIALFPLLGTSPKDTRARGLVTKQATERRSYRKQMELVSSDKNKDGLVSFREYLPHFLEEDIGMYLSFLIFC